LKKDEENLSLSLSLSRDHDSKVFTSGRVATISLEVMRENRMGEGFKTDK
jgi:hypothetical protein